MEGVVVEEVQMGSKESLGGNWGCSKLGLEGGPRVVWSGVQRNPGGVQFEVYGDFRQGLGRFGV